MPSSRIPSPSRSQGARSTPRRYKPRPSRSLCSPARSNNSIKLSAVIRSQMDSFVLSPMPTRRSVLADTTEIDVPRRRSWWRKLDENSREIMEVLNNKEPIEANNAIEEYIEVDVLSQEKKDFTFDLPESSDSESISSIVIPQRKLFTQKENQPENKFGQIINTRESLAKLHKSQAIDEKGLNVGTKNLFNRGTKPRSKPIFPSALLNISVNKTTANKTKEQPINEAKGQIKCLFGNKPSAERKNMFADFIVSESEDEVPVFVSQKKLEQKRNASLNNEAEQEPLHSSVTDIEMALLNISANKTTANKSKEQPTNKGKGQIKSLFGNKPSTKRKNMFADFIVSESEDEVPVFVSQKKLEQKRNANLNNHADREPSPLSITDIEMDDWRLLPSSTMVDHQLEEGLRNTPSKRARLEKLSEANNTIANKTKQSNISLNSKNKSKIGETPTSAITNQEKQKPADDIDTQNTTRQSLRRKDTSNKNASHERSTRKETNKTKDNKNASQMQIVMESVNSINVAVKNDSKNTEAKEKLNQTKTRSRIDQALQSDDDEDNFTLEYENDDEPVKENRENKTIRENETQNSQHSSKIEKDNNQQSNISIESQKSSKEQKIQADKNEQVKNDNEKLVENREEDDTKNQMIDNFVESQNDSQEIENDRTDKEHEDGQEDQESDVEERGPDQKEQQHQQEQENDFKEKDVNQPNKEQQEEHLSISLSKKVRESNNTPANKTSHLNESFNLKNKSKTKNVLEEQETDQAGDDIENELENNVDEQETEQEEENDLQEQKHDDDGNKSEDDIEEESNASYQAVEDDEHLRDDSEVEDNEQEYNNTSQNISNEDESEQEIEQDHDESDAENEEQDNDIDQNESRDVADGEMQGSVQNMSQDVEEGDEEIENELDEEQDNDIDQNESRDVADGEMQGSVQNMSQDVEEGDEEIENELEVEDVEKEDEENTNESEKNYSQDTEDVDERQNSYENEEDDNEPDDVEEIEDDDTDTNDEQNDSQNEVDNEIVNNDSDGDENNGHQSIAHNEEQISRQNTEANLTHDTTGRHRKKYDSKVTSPEAILHEKTTDMESFVKGRNTSVRKTKSIIKNLNIRPSLAPVRESTGLTDGSNDMSAEGSGWDSHRTTRVTLRKTFGKDFTPSKSLRALVMEKSAKRQTVANLETDAEISKHPRANSTELPEPLDMHDDDGDDADEGQDMQESDHEESRRMRQTTLETYLQKIKQQNAERSKQLDEKIRSSLQKNAPRIDVFNSFKVPAVPKRRIRPLQSKPKAKPVKSVIPLDMLPPELLEDMKYKPPKRYRPANASWITKRLYKFLESKLAPKYDYKARIRSEKLVETIYNFTKDIRRQRVAPSEAVNLLKLEMARLDVVKTHFDFYEFFHEFMPREVRIKVNPDVFNNISLPKHGVFSDILR